MKKAFTLAEVLVTITLIGVIAAITVPSIIVNTQEHEYRSGLRKAVTALNQAIAANIAMEGENAARNKDLFNYLQRHMNVTNTVSKMYEDTGVHGVYNNAAFYTADGIKYMFYRANDGGRDTRQGSNWDTFTYESKNNDKIPNTAPCFGNTAPGIYSCTFVGPKDNRTCEYRNISRESSCGGCGSRGLVENPQYNKPPCIITVDVNGDNKPNPANMNCREPGSLCNQQNKEKRALPSPGGKKFTDLFTIMITENKAVPYGTYAQKMMYQK